jgi:hypothetical protein
MLASIIHAFAYFQPSREGLKTAAKGFPRRNELEAAEGLGNEAKAYLLDVAELFFRVQSHNEKKNDAP